MGLFSKKISCPICGNKIAWLSPAKIGDEYICASCSNKIDMDPSIANRLSMQEFREYLEFYEENQQLKKRFVINQKIDFGYLDNQIVFDTERRLFSLNKKLDKTIFEGNQLKAFVIKEDSVTIFEGTTTMINRYDSSVPERVMAFAPIIDQFERNKPKSTTIGLDDDKKSTDSKSYFDAPGPFKSFHLELYLEHPYWTLITCDMDGPRFDRHMPNVNDYLRSYQHMVAELEKLVNAFQLVAFPEAIVKTFAFAKDIGSSFYVEEIDISNQSNFVNMNK